MKRFDQLGSREARALQGCQILIGAAHNRQILTHGTLAAILHVEGAGVFSQTSGRIMCWRQDNELPPLAALVVKKDTGLPGDGLTTAEDANKSREKVFEFDWCALVPPTPAELAAACQSGSGRNNR